MMRQQLPDEAASVGKPLLALLAGRITQQQGTATTLKSQPVLSLIQYASLHVDWQDFVEAVKKRPLAKGTDVRRAVDPL
jgi:hypothetical protein